MDSKFTTPGGLKIHNSLDISRRKEPVTYQPGPGQCTSRQTKTTSKNTASATPRTPTPKTRTQESGGETAVRWESSAQRSSQVQVPSTYQLTKQSVFVVRLMSPFLLIISYASLIIWYYMG